MYLTVEEAAKILIDKLQKEFGDDAGNINILKATAAVYNNPILYKENHKFQWQLKAMASTLEHPRAGLYHQQIWKWAGLALTKVFETKA